MFDKILDILSNLGLPGLFVGIYLEALGLPFPGSVLVALAGFLCKQGAFNIFLTWSISMLGYLLGSISAFLIGQHVGKPFLIRWGKYIKLTPERFAKAQDYLNRSAPGFIIGGRFLPTVGNITPYVAGLSGISIYRFLLLDFIHAVLWLTTFLGAGVFFGRNWQRRLEGANLNWLWIAGGIFLLLYFFRHMLPFKVKKKI